MNKAKNKQKEHDFRSVFYIPEKAEDKQKLIKEILERSGSADMLHMIALVESLYGV